MVLNGLVELLCFYYLMLSLVCFFPLLSLLSVEHVVAIDISIDGFGTSNPGNFNKTTHGCQS